MRQLMDLPAETKITRKFLREAMTMAQYESAWQYYSEVLKKHVEEDVLDFPPPSEQTSPADSQAFVSQGDAGEQKDASEPDGTSMGASRSIYATPQQIARLKLLAQQVGDDAYADVQDMLDHHREGITLDVYQVVKQRLRGRRATQLKDAPAERQG